jgi:hypothetical protein
MIKVAMIALVLIRYELFLCAQRNLVWTGIPVSPCVDTILLSRIGIFIDLLKFPQFFNGLMHISENRESEKPDGLCFARGLNLSVSETG